MQGKYHHVTGVMTALPAFALAQQLELHPVLVAIGCIAGGKCPDWLEIPLQNGSGRRLIPHRRITHWMFGWIAIFFLCLWWNKFDPVFPSALAGFSLGALTHILMDVVNPTGVPVLHPWRRSSLNWWPGGKRDFLQSMMWFFTCLTLYVVLVKL